MQRFCGSPARVVPVTTQQEITDPVKEQVHSLLTDVRLGLLDGVKHRVDCARCTLVSPNLTPTNSRPTTPVSANSSTHSSYICSSKKPTTVSCSRPGTPVNFANEKPPALDECTDSDSLNPLHLAAQGK